MATAFATLLLGGTAMPVQAVGAGLVPHEAHYTLRLSRDSRGGDISAVRGSMQIRFVASCDGWRIEQALAFRMLSLDGARLEHLAQFDAFEESDGSALVFTSRTWEDRELVEDLSGRARRKADGVVEVKFARPEARTELLPAGTVFPSEHLRQVLAAAVAGRRTTLHTVFDGSSEDSPYEISGVIGTPQAPSGERPPDLADVNAWPVRLAYFDLGALEPKAGFEMGVELYANGVAGDMTYDYGDFAIDVGLDTVTLLDLPRCN